MLKYLQCFLEAIYCHYGSSANLDNLRTERYVLLLSKSSQFLVVQLLFKILFVFLTLLTKVCISASASLRMKTKYVQARSDRGGLGGVTPPPPPPTNTKGTIQVNSRNVVIENQVNLGDQK